jgi:6-pyruvoyltetrahydropterin/6-carboxytetrahydropterin synthase
MNAMGQFQIRVEKEQSVFSAGHFITYDGHKCEPLHGHNYRVAVQLSGPLDENAYVFDFTRIKELMKKIVDELDHRMLLPARSERIHVATEGDRVTASYKDKHYVFPRSDVVLLPIPNTTAEMLAQWIAGRLKEALDPTSRRALTALDVEVEESFGQRAIYHEDA